MSDKDEFYEDAVKFVIAEGNARVSQVQRQFVIGYNRAAWLIEAMEANGVVSKLDKHGNRKILIKEQP